MASYPIKTRVQHAAPAFAAEAVVPGSDEFKSVSLDDYKGKYVVLFFYPHDFTFVCPTEICGFSDRIEEFRALNAEVVGVSCNSKFCHRSWVQTPRTEGGLGGCSYPLLADWTKQIAKDYGVLLEDGDDEGSPLRGLFIIDEKGILRQITVNDLPVGRDIDETLRLIAAFQHADTHGEVCPLGWHKGKPTMHDSHDSKKTQDFFKEGTLNSFAGDKSVPNAKRARKN